jgi:hypothetical protein
MPSPPSLDDLAALDPARRRELAAALHETRWGAKVLTNLGRTSYEPHNRPVLGFAIWMAKPVRHLDDKATNARIDEVGICHGSLATYNNNNGYGGGGGFKNCVGEPVDADYGAVIGGGVESTAALGANDGRAAMSMSYRNWPGTVRPRPSVPVSGNPAG